MKPDDSPLVSVILCFYNEEKFLTEAVESVLSQDYRNWELFLVDDGSSDGSVAIAKKFAADFPGKIFYLEHDLHANKGLSASRNLGIAHIRGKHIAFIDADDVWLPSKLTHQLAIFKKNPKVTVVLESSNYWSSWAEDGHEDVVIPVGANEGVYSPPELMLKLYPLGPGAAPCPSGIMVSRLTLRRCSFEESFRGIYQMYEDQAFLCKVYLKETVYVSAACHNFYRQRPSSLVSSVHDSGKYHVVRKFYLNWFRQYLAHQAVQFQAVNELLDRAELRYKRPFWHRLTVDLPAIVKGRIEKVLIRSGIKSYHRSW
jgi:glycosyltransferase involved in cell wall biosynthesis